jgi:hypothetical protein
MGGACSTYGESRGEYRVLVRKPEGRNHLEDAGIDGRIILKYILENLDGGLRNGSIWLRIRTVVVLL